MASDNAATRAWTAFSRTINAGVNAATGGMFNKGIGALMGLTPEQVDAGNAAMRASVGTAGNVAAGLGNVYGLTKLGQAGGAVLRAPAAAAAATERAFAPFAVTLPTARGLVAAAVPKTFGGAAKLAAGGAALAAPIIAGMDNTVVATPAAAAKPSAPNAVAAAMAQGKAAAPAITPYEQQLAALNTILRSPNMTMHDLQLVTGMLPKPNKPYSPKDVITGTANDQSTAMLNQALKDAAAKADPAEAAAARDKAYQEDFLRKVSLINGNPVNAAQAPMFIPDQEN